MKNRIKELLAERGLTRKHFYKEMIEKYGFTEYRIKYVYNNETVIPSRRMMRCLCHYFQTINPSDLFEINDTWLTDVDWSSKNVYK